MSGMNVRDSKTIQMAHDKPVVKNTPVIIDGFVMMPLNTGEANELIAYGTEGSFYFNSKSGNKLSIGQKAYFSTTDKSVSETATDTYIGRVVAIFDGEIEVKINVV